MLLTGDPLGISSQTWTGSSVSSCTVWCYVGVLQQYTMSQRCWIVFIIQELLPLSSHMRLSTVMRRRNPGPTAPVWQDLILVPLTSLMSVWSSKDIQYVSLDHHWLTGKQVTLEEAAGRVFSTASPDSLTCVTYAKKLMFIKRTIGHWSICQCLGCRCTGCYLLGSFCRALTVIFLSMQGHTASPYVNIKYTSTSHKVSLFCLINSFVPALTFAFS